MIQSATWSTTTTYTEPDFNEAADVAYGTFLCLCFLIGTAGNLVSFIYFVTKKRDISSVIYMLITVTDTVISIMALPVGISFISQRQPGILFGNKYGCLAWIYAWKVAISLSVFLVLCLCTTRTISLLKPFKQQKIRYLVLAIVIYSVLMLARVIDQHLSSDKISFSSYTSRCDMLILRTRSGANIIVVLLSYNIVFTAPAFVVAISSFVSAVELTRGSKRVQQIGHRQSKNRSTATILLFAILYGVCNIPLIVIYIIRTISVATNNPELEYKVFQFDTQGYYNNAAITLLLAANSAANPVLYFWRMSTLRKYIILGVRNRSVRGIRRILGRNKGVGASVSRFSATHQTVLTSRVSRAYLVKKESSLSLNSGGFRRKRDEHAEKLNDNFN